MGHININITGTQTLQAEIHFLQNGLPRKVFIQLDIPHLVKQGALPGPDDSKLCHNRNLFPVHAIKGLPHDPFALPKVIARCCIYEIHP